MLLVQLWAVLVTLLGGFDEFFTRLGIVSLYSQWVGLAVVLVLCSLRKKLNRLSDIKALWSVVGLCLATFLLVEVASQVAVNGFQTRQIDWPRLARNGLITTLLTFVMVRVLSLASVLEQRNKAEAESRIQALQSRIRPHFLFNSLNTIAELTAADPVRAERAIDSLALLFRASLETERGAHSLESELNLCKRYIDLEQSRLEERLNVQWEINVQDAKTLLVPKLILQPLIENAIVHGGDANGRVQVLIDLRETKHDVSLVVENNINSQQEGMQLNPQTKGDAVQHSVEHGVKHAVKHASGNGIALDNIRERLFVLYDDNQTFKVRIADDAYRVLMRFPKQIRAQV